MGILHVLSELVRLNYVYAWTNINNELQRLARIAPLEKNTSGYAQELLLSLPWLKAVDFCERIYSHLAQDAGEYDRENDRWETVKTRSTVQQYIESELNLIFAEEGLNLEMLNGEVRRRGRRHTSQRVDTANSVLGDSRFGKARAHYAKALRYFRDVKQPDPENCFKEAVCAV